VSAPDEVVPQRVFLAIATVLAVMTAIYAATSGERAGTTMLALSACFALVVAVYLRAGPTPSSGHGDDDHYLPASSVWPLAIGMAAFLLLNGLLLGTWFLVPGGLLMAGSVIGFARQSRHRA
jgi:hypothetical protein